MLKKVTLIAVFFCLILSFGFAQDVKVQYKCGDTIVKGGQVKPIFNLVNTGSTDVNYSDLTLRYYFMKEGTAEMNLQVDYAVMGSGNIGLEYIRDVEEYLQITFTGGTLAAGAESGEIQIRVNKTDWSNFDQANDWSFDPSIVDFADYNKVALYSNGVLIWGIDYELMTPSPTPVPTPTPTPFPTDGLDSYTIRFLDLWNELHDNNNGYFSPEGAPYHSIETLMCEAPDYGHETTSEAYSYYIWLEAAYAGVTGVWDYLYTAWDRTEAQIIPTDEMQYGNAKYQTSSPATYAAEWDLPDSYPSALQFDWQSAVGQDPISEDLHAAYGDSIYGMHWLLDCDNFYGYGNMGDGKSKPSYINTFQRGAQESVWETIPHPSWEAFKWGGANGFLDLFTGDNSYASQWRYTNAPDADARMVQAMYWANLYAKEQNVNIDDLIAKSVKMGDFLRLSFFDKYFKKIGPNTTEEADGGTGYDSAHFLLSWYYAWGGGIEAEWAWRIGCSHNHFGYQNPVAAWVLSQDPDFTQHIKTSTGQQDWATSLDRQIEFYLWLQSSTGPYAGGATNSWKGRYLPYPAGKSTFYGMAYDEKPVYHDPGSNTWFGWQAWSIERLAEYYLLTGDAAVGESLKKWTDWVKASVKLHGDDDFELPVSFVWSGQPDTWTGTPSANTGLTVEIEAYNRDVGITGCLAKTLIYYAAATEKHEPAVDAESQYLAKELLDRLWNTYRDDKGIAAPETRGDYKRFFEQEVYVPTGFSGVMPNGDVIEPGVTFAGLRTNYETDPMYADLLAAYNAGEDPTFNYHRTWAQIDIALANLAYAEYFGESVPDFTPTPNPIENLGDANGDGAVDILDALAISRYSVGFDVPGFVAANADVNADGVIDIVDALLVARASVGLITL